MVKFITFFNYKTKEIKMKTVSGSKKLIKIIAFVLTQTVLFSNGAFCLEAVSRQKQSHDLLSPYLNIGGAAIRNAFSVSELPIKLFIKENIVKMITPLTEQDKHTVLLNENIKRYHNITIDNKALSRFKKLWQIEEVDIGAMWDLMLEITGMPLLEKIEKIVGGAKHHQLLHVKGTVDSLAKINEYRKGNVSEVDVIEFLNPGYKGKQITPGCVHPLLERYKQIDPAKFKVLALSVILHDYGKLIAWSNEGKAGECD